MKQLYALLMVATLIWGCSTKQDILPAPADSLKTVKIKPDAARPGTDTPVFKIDTVRKAVTLPAPVIQRPISAPVKQKTAKTDTLYQVHFKHGAYSATRIVLVPHRPKHLGLDTIGDPGQVHLEFFSTDGSIKRIDTTQDETDLIVRKPKDGYLRVKHLNTATGKFDKVTKMKVAAPPRVFLAPAPTTVGATAPALINIHVTGPNTNRLNIVFLGEGYLNTPYDYNKFIKDATNEYLYLSTVYPYSSYQNFVNWYAIYTPSNDSVINHPHTAADCPSVATQPTVTTANTFYGCTFDAWGIHREIKANLTTVNNTLLAVAPFFDASAIMVNTTYYGGAADGANSIMTMDGSLTSVDGMAHELFGHTISGVGDEYSYSGCGGIEEWNTTQDTAAATNRWKAWFPKGRPNPSGPQQISGPAATAATPPSTIGLWLGANYCPTNWYRPQNWCKMKALGYPFCSICMERFVYAMNYYVNNIDSYSPTATSVILTAGQTQTFSVVTVNPVPNSLSVIWKRDGTIVSNGIIQNDLMTPGAHTLSVTVTDTTHLSRTAMPVRTVSWTVTSVKPSGVTTLAPLAPICAGTTITLSGGSPLGGTFSGTNVSNGVFGPAVPGTYVITYKAGATSATQSIVVNAVPNVTVADGNICQGGSISLSAAGASSYTWNPLNGLSAANGSTVVASPTITTTYTVTGTSNNGCTAVANSIITVTPIPVLTVTPAVSICPGGSATLTATGAATYAWSPAAGLNSSTGSKVITTPASGITYTVTGANNGCLATAKVVVTVTSVTPVVVSNVTMCAGGSATLTATGADTYVWTPATGLMSTTGSSVLAIPAFTTTYTITGTSATGCHTVGVATAVLTVVQLPSITVSPTTSAVIAGGSVTLVASGANTYTWSPVTGLSSANAATVTSTPAASVTYTVSGTVNGCKASASAVVNVQAVNTCPLIGWINFLATAPTYTFVTWNWINASKSYSIRYRQVGASSWKSLQNVSNNTATIIQGLTTKTQYEVQIQTNCASGNSGWSNSYGFTTK